MAGGKTQFVYVTLIRAPAAKVWDALTTPEFTRKYWYGTKMSSDGGWKKGARWKMEAPTKVTDDGVVQESTRPTRLVLSWTNRMVPEMEEEGASRCTFELEEKGGVTTLTVTHEIGHSPSKLIDGVSWGWPRILSSLKSLLETGAPLAETTEWPEGM